MRLRTVVWTAAMSVVSIALVFLGVVVYSDWRLHVRTEEYLAERRAWMSAVRAERSPALERLARIRAELAGSDLPSWAGEYAWSGVISDGMCGMVERRVDGEGFAVAPQAGAVWWFGGPDPESASVLDHGRIVTVDEDRLVVEWTMKPLHAHAHATLDETPLLSDELVRVQWDDAPFLVPSVRVPVFCSKWIASWDAPATFAPRKGGWTVRADASDPELPHYRERPPPQVPERWRPFVLTNPITAQGRLEAPPDLVVRWDAIRPGGLSPWWTRITDRRDTAEYSLVRWRFTVSAGSDQGLRVGMPLTLQQDWLPVRGVVTAVSPGAAHVEILSYGIDSLFAGELGETPRFTTGFPGKM